MQSLAELGRVAVQSDVFHFKGECLRVCTEGPISVVYPERACSWNSGRENPEQIIQCHLIGGEATEDLLIATNSLGQAPPTHL